MSCLIQLNLRNIKPCALYLCRTYAKQDAGAVSMLGGSLAKKKKAGKLGAVVEKKVLPVETDVKKLVNYVCGSNIYKTGEDIQLKPDAEYPDWLWEIHTGPPLTLEQLEPNSKEYYLRIRKIGMRRNNKMAQLNSF